MLPHPAMVTMPQIYAALVASRGHRGEAARSLSMPLRTFQRRLAEANCAEKLAKMAGEHGWPPATAAATRASAKAAAVLRAERIAGA